MDYLFKQIGQHTDEYMCVYSGLRVVKN